MGITVSVEIKGQKVLKTLLAHLSDIHAEPTLTTD